MYIFPGFVKIYHENGEHVEAGIRDGVKIFTGYDSGYNGNGIAYMVTDICFSDTMCGICSGVLVFHCDIYDGEGIVALYA